MDIVKFTSEDYIKSNTIIEMNVDDDKISPVIIKVQSTYLQQILGSNFYKHLSQSVVNQTLSTKEENLLREYIQPYIAEYVVYESLPFLNYKMTNKAISKESSEFSEASNLKEVKYLRSNVKDMAEFLGRRLEKFLCDNASDFPVYQNPKHPENLPKKNKSFFNGVYIPK